ncbi:MULTISPECIES: SpoIIE family protein phosphatase [unclassified Modestobacter]|uniref:SpoIIE family protein phosphatase n=1 Tax=unclassified Modestobacter TaxID=2643866 RepID=UPI0022AA69EE|nr:MULTISPECIES: SpoIIE family protein phosphatase [unclassified Modestobacter]MCZ2825670.1 SpoIIE family protein phosphatase [Modestobacter sp. VKM Ac-2981]MCZ2853265.1 SpoIIE family protein phosphatase [Modestobacter sp. VKM Ac-2982]
MPAPSTPVEPDPLADPARVAVARRLLVELPGSAPFDRLARLASRLLAVPTAQVVLLTDVAVRVGGCGRPTALGSATPLDQVPGSVAARLRAPLVVPDAAADPRVAGQPAVASGEVRSCLSVPLVLAAGDVVGALTLISPEPRSWSEDDVVLAGEVAATVVTELELVAASIAVRSSLSRLELTLEASEVGSWERDLRTGVTTWDERNAAIFGLPGPVTVSGDEVMAQYIHPGDHAAVQQAMDVALAGTGEFVVEMRVLRTDGEVRWTVSRGRVGRDQSGEPVRLLGTTVDVTEARQQARLRLAAVQRAAVIAEVAADLANADRMSELAEAALRGAAVLGADASALAVFAAGRGPLRLHMTRRLVDAVESGTDAVLSEAGVELPLDDELPTQYVARHGEPVLLGDRAAAVARFPRMAEVGDLVGVRALAALPLRLEGRLLGSFTAVWSEDHVFTPEDLELLQALTAQIGLSISRLHADAQRDAALAEMAAANVRLELLAETGRVLSGTLEITEQLGRLAELVVPALGDWCWVVVTDEHGRMRQLASAHRDRARSAELADYVRAMVGGMTEHAAARVVTRTGRPLRVPGLDAAYVARALPDPASRERLARLQPDSGIVVPLVSRGRTLGALGLYLSAERGQHTDVELDTALELGRRAGVALQQARLFGQQRQLAETLQRSMLTAPPAPDHCEIAVRYVPAAAGAEVGGDWYDAFVQPDGATMLVIGDVVGHDSRAAAAMGQLRGLLRGIGHHTGGTPAEVLTGLDRASSGLDLDVMATALIARLEQDPPELAAAETRIRWATAGHPPPVLLSADGEVAVLDGGDPDLLLGVDPDTVRSDRVAVIGRGGTLLLYTDGLVERRDRDLDAGIAELCRVLAGLTELPLQQLCDRLLQRMYLPDTEDDVALLAVRLHPQGVPRPAEAGPQHVPPGIEPAPAVHPEAGPS